MTPDVVTLPRVHALVWAAIAAHPGAGAATPAAAIVAEAGLKGELKSAQLREVVHDLRVVWHLPVGSNPRGYFEMVTAREFAGQRLRMRRRARRILAAAGALKTAWRRFNVARPNNVKARGEQRALWREDGPVVQQRTPSDTVAGRVTVGKRRLEAAPAQ